MKHILIITILIIFSTKISFSAENRIEVETTTSNLFQNIISDTILLLDPDLKKIVSVDLDSVIKKSEFNYQGYSWPPRTNPKYVLSNIYEKINKHNVSDSLARMVEPVVEIACTPKKYDPLNELSPKCIKNLLKYPIINPIEINYAYDRQKDINQYIVELSNLNDNNRYPQMVKTIAGIMNSAYEKSAGKNVVVTTRIIKNPIELAGIASTGGTSIEKCDYRYDACESKCYGSTIRFDKSCQPACAEARAVCKMSVISNSTSPNSNTSSNKYNCIQKCQYRYDACESKCYGSTIRFDKSCQPACAEARAVCKMSCS